MKYVGLIIQTTSGPPMVVDTKHEHVEAFIHAMSHGEEPMAELRLDGGKPRYYVRRNIIMIEPLNEADWKMIVEAQEKAETRQRMGRIQSPIVQAG